MINSAVRNSIRGAGRQAYPHQVARTLPRAGLLLYLGRPNLEAADVPLGDDTEIGDDTIIRWKFLLPADVDIRAATGWVSGAGNIFYDAAGDPVAVFASEIADWADINRYNVLFHLVSADTETGRLAIYALDADHATLNKARRVLREDQYDYLAPLGAILHYDAEVAGLTELVGGVHTLNHSVLGPQYQRLADGSYINVGAQPAVDVLASGVKGLRTCGAITNLVAASAANYLTGWILTHHSVVDAGTLNGLSAVRITTTSGILSYERYSYTYSFSGAMTFKFVLKSDNLLTYKFRGSSVSVDGYVDINFATKTTTSVNGSNTTYNSTEFKSIDETTAEISITATATADFVNPGFNFDTTVAGKSFVLAGYTITATAYPTPYVPPGVTQPASNTTTTNGTWFALPDGSPLWQALTGSPFTLATRIPMGVGSGDLTSDQIISFVACQASSVYGPHLLQRFAGPGYNILRANDGVSSANKVGSWSRNAVVQRFTQVNEAGTRFRVGYVIEGTYTAIQWSHASEDSSTWALFDGSFNPSTLYRFMLGYSNPYPMWFNKITAWKRQVPATELEAWA